MNKDEVAGKAEQVKGAAKKKAGQWTGNTELEAEGAVDEAAGKVRETAGTVKRKAEEVADEVRDQRRR